MAWRSATRSRLDGCVRTVRSACWAAAVVLVVEPVWADVASVELFGLSAHLGAAYDGAPRKLDENGVYVFNPGVGAEWDFRESVSKTGFSPIVKVGWLEDCNDRPVYAALGGARYWHVFSGGFVIGGSLSAGVVNGENWDTEERTNTFAVVPILEIGHVIGEDYLPRLGVMYVPPNSAISATDNDGLLFYSLAFGRTL